MNIQVLFFAGLRETLGVEREAIELPAGVDTAGGVRAFLCARGAAWAQALGEGRSVRIAVDHAMVAAHTPIHEGAAVAFFPPVTGG